MADNKPEVAVIMGSASDWETMKHACEMLDQFEVPYMKQVISAHRTPELQMPGGIPVATTAVGNSGATNAGLLAVSILSTTDERLAKALQDYRDSLKEKVAESNAQLV